jgi:predicted dehydrogenase
MDGPEASTQLYGTAVFGQIFPTRRLLPRAGQQEAETYDPGFPPVRDPHCPQSMYDTQMAYFLDCVQTGREPSPGGTEGLLNMRVVDAAYKSAESGEIVKL